MEIINVRVDERLVHAQVTINWINYLKPDRIVVIDDNILADDVQKNALKLSCPKDVKLTIVEADKAASRFKEDFFGDEKILILTRGIKAISRLIDNDYMLKDITIGNLSYKADDMVKINEHISVSPLQIEMLRKLIAKGIMFYAQLLPPDIKENIII